ncbi:MAG: hypothetical protein IKB02_04140 [Clostridia bacterium]|nr:hypothetical protein [Clostridia bacterium]
MKKLSIILALLLVAALLFGGCTSPADDTQGTDSEALTSAPETTEPKEEGPKNVMIFGDSYSTFEGYIPKTYKTWYYAAGRAETDVKQVSDTWWYPLCNEMGYNLVMNDSYSGSTIGYTGYSGADTSQSSSFIHRLELYKNQNYFEKNDIDLIFVFGGTNDSWCGAPLGEYKTENISKSDCYNVLPAIVYFLTELKEAAPNAEIVFIINTDLKAEIGETVKKASAHLGTSYVELTKFQKRSSHPTVLGMASIKAQVKRALG